MKHLFHPNITHFCANNAFQSPSDTHTMESFELNRIARETYTFQLFERDKTFFLYFLTKKSTFKKEWARESEPSRNLHKNNVDGGV